MNRRNDIIQFFLSLGILVLIVFLSSLTYSKLDLTSEKRHTLTDATKDLLGSIEDKMLIRCYLAGEFPAKYKRLERAIRETLDEFRDYSNDQIEFEFVDTQESGDKETIGQIEQRLFEQGLQFTRIAFEDGGAQSFRLIWPAAIISYGGRERTVQFLKSENPDLPDGMINASINNLEYELASNIRQILRTDKMRIAFLEGHGELEEMEVADIYQSLSDYYAVSRVRIDGKLNVLTEKLDQMKNRTLNYDLLIIAKPDSVFDNKDKLIIDQFAMNGGKIMWLIDPILTDLDSLRERQQTYGITNEMGLYDMLFDYGVRLNRNIIIDRSCALIGFDSGPMGNQRNMQMFNWYFSPVIIPSDTAHPTVSNLDPIRLDFTSSLDLVGENDSLKKTILLASSFYSREFKSPVRINSSIVNIDPNFKENNKPHQPIAVMMEGIFNSNFRDRLPAELVNDKDFAFREKSKPTKMLVIADGDIIRNQVVPAGEGQFEMRPLGYDRYIGRVVYDNKDFLLNAINYMLDDAALISMRSRSIELRKMDEEKVIAEKSRWQTINMIIPILLVALLGIAQFYMRKRKFAV